MLEPTLVLYTDSVNSACGAAGVSVGILFIVREIENLYIDYEAFIRNYKQNSMLLEILLWLMLIAHEVGHDVQTLLGTTEQVMPLRQK